MRIYNPRNVFTQTTETIQPHRKYIRLGEYNTDEAIDCIYKAAARDRREPFGTAGKFCADAPINVPVESIAVPAYDPHTYANDIALVRLARAVRFTSFIKPISLPGSAADSGLVAGNIVTVAGWGKTDLCECVIICDL